MLRAIYSALPPRVRASLKRAFGASGHRRNFLDRLRARHLAKTRKRFHVIEPKLDRRLALAGITSLEGARCMEFGCGMMPTELAYFWMLGARKLVAVDYNRIAHFRYMPIALADEPRLSEFDTNVIDYRAPFNFKERSIPGMDLIHSESVLEHISPRDVPAVLRNLRDSLAAGGVMIHSIDLRDHLDLANDPHAFLTDPEYDPNTDYDARGNSLRRSEWLSAFRELGLEIECHPEAPTPGRPLPPDIDDDKLALFAVIVARKKI